MKEIKDTRKIKLLKAALNKKLEDFRKLRISNIPKVEVVITPENEKTKSKSFFSKFLKK
ncbi:hypothetical protein [Flavobacterium sp. WC2509]|uniref:hypothetical protein n=1 Tax=Flavobacterium sp. WC2509 TaxID=3461406 RepID=UPI0040448715